MTADNYIKGRLAAFCIDEGFAHGGLYNMVAVAHVLKNRVEAGWFGGDWMRVLEAAPSQRGTLRDIAREVDLRDGSIRLLFQAIDDIYSGTIEDNLTAGALFYADLHNLTNPEFKANVLQNPESHPRIATVGLTAFFG